MSTKKSQSIKSTPKVKKRPSKATAKVRIKRVLKKNKTPNSQSKLPKVLRPPKVGKISRSAAVKAVKNVKKQIAKIKEN